jgi:hypothetical protein
MSQFQPPQGPFPQGSRYPQWQSPSQPLTPQSQWQQQPDYAQPPTYYPPQPQNQQPPVKPPVKARPPKKRSPLVWLISGLIVGVIIGYAVHVPSSQSTSPTTSATTQATNQPTQEATTAAVTPTPAHTPKWTTVQTFTGNGSKKTGIFTMPNDWKILWSCNPSSFYGGQYNVIVNVDNSDGSYLDEATINTLCHAGNTSDQTEEHQGGQVYLDVTSEGSWTIQVQELK